MAVIRILPTGPKQKPIYLPPYAIKGINIRMTSISSSDGALLRKS